MTIFKSFGFKTTALAALIAMGFAAERADAQQSYLMTCRGGGDMLAIAGQRVSDPHVFVEITYKRATQGAGVQAPAPGECAWIDRGVNADEPNKIMFKDMGVSWTQTACQNGRCWTRTPSRPATDLMNAVMNGQPFQLHVYNDRAGNMIVTRVGP